MMKIKFILLWLLLSGCTNEDVKKVQKYYSDLNELCINGVTYYRVNGFKPMGVTPAFDRNGKIMLCENEFVR